jgi:hypothetical protein
MRGADPRSTRSPHPRRYHPGYGIDFYPPPKGGAYPNHGSGHIAPDTVPVVVLCRCARARALPPGPAPCAARRASSACTLALALPCPTATSAAPPLETLPAAAHPAHPCRELPALVPGKATSTPPAADPARAGPSQAGHKAESALSPHQQQAPRGRPVYKGALPPAAACSRLR